MLGMLATLIIYSIYYKFITLSVWSVIGVVQTGGEVNRTSGSLACSGINYSGHTEPGPFNV